MIRTKSKAPNEPMDEDSMNEQNSNNLTGLFQAPNDPMEARNNNAAEESQSGGHQVSNELISHKDLFNDDFLQPGKHRKGWKFIQQKCFGGQTTGYVQGESQLIQEYTMYDLDEPKCIAYLEKLFQSFPEDYRWNEFVDRMQQMPLDFTREGIICLHTAGAVLPEQSVPTTRIATEESCQSENQSQIPLAKTMSIPDGKGGSHQFYQLQSQRLQ